MVDVLDTLTRSRRPLTTAEVREDTGRVDVLRALGRLEARGRVLRYDADTWDAVCPLVDFRFSARFDSLERLTDRCAWGPRIGVCWGPRHHEGRLPRTRWAEVAHCITDDRECDGGTS